MPSTDFLSPAGRAEAVRQSAEWARAHDNDPARGVTLLAEQLAILADVVRGVAAAARPPVDQCQGCTHYAIRGGVVFPARMDCTHERALDSDLDRAVMRDLASRGRCPYSHACTEPDAYRAADALPVIELDLNDLEG